MTVPQSVMISSSRPGVQLKTPVVPPIGTVPAAPLERKCQNTIRTYVTIQQGRARSPARAHTAAKARGAFQILLAAGLSALMGIQALMIMGGVVKLVPLTGVTMPLMSYGGSSLVAQFLMIGLLLKLSSRKAE
jgi:hypothetical protein